MALPTDADQIVVYDYWLDEKTGVGVVDSRGRPATVTLDPVPLGSGTGTVTPNLRDLTSGGWIKTRQRVATVDAVTGYFAVLALASNDPDLDAYGGRKVTFAGETPFVIEIPYNASTVTVSAAMAAATGLTQGATVKAIRLSLASVVTNPPPTPSVNYLTSVQTVATAEDAADAAIVDHDADTSAHPSKANASALTAHTSNTSNPHSVTKAQVGLGNVDNTTDAGKPVSTAQAAAIAAASTNDRARANHTGTQTAATLSDFTEAVQDVVAGLLGAGSNVTLNYDDTANTLTVSATGSGGTGLDAEQVRDAIGVAVVGIGAIAVTVNDGADTITISTTATVNSTDAQLRDRTTHTGAQAISTVTGLQAALDAKISEGELVLNVKDYGAAGNGSTNDTTAIQAALNAVPTGGGTVYFPVGTYLVPNGGLTCANPVRLAGVSGIDGTGSRIHVTADSVTGLTLNGSSSTIEHLSITHPLGGTRSTNLVGLVVDNANFAYLENVRVVGFSKNALVTNGVYYTLNSCLFRDFVEIGLELINPLAGGDAADSTVQGCTFDRGSDVVNGGTAVLWESGGGLRFVNNKINGRPANKFLHGIRFVPSTGITTGVLMVANNSIENFTGVGVSLLDNAGGGGVFNSFLLTGNEIAAHETTASTGFYTDEDVSGVVITGNHFYSLTHALDIQRAKHVTVSGNSLSNIKTTGLRVRNLARNVMLDSQPIDMEAGGYAVQFDDPTYVVDARYETTIPFRDIQDTVDHPLCEIVMPQYATAIIDCEIVGVNQNDGTFVKKLTRVCHSQGLGVEVYIPGGMAADYTGGSPLAVNFDVTTVGGSVRVGVQRSMGTDTSGQARIKVWGNGFYRFKSLLRYN